MCGRYAITLPPEMLVGLFNLSNAIDYPPRYNVTPTQPIAVIWEQQGRRTVQLVRWGFLPGWVKDPREFALLVNARAAGMADKPSFRNAVKNSRCIIPASGYFEWMKGTDGKKRPHYIYAADGEPLAFAGLYSTWSGPDGEEVDTACIVTVDPNLDISSPYDRMPAILRGEAIEQWLNTRDVAAKAAAALAVTPPPGTMSYHAVGKAIGSAMAEGPELIAPLSAEELAVEPAPKSMKKSSGGQLDLF